MIGPVIFGTAMWIREYRAGGLGIGDVQHAVLSRTIRSPERSW